jgi:hypothetical protein
VIDTEGKEAERRAEIERREREVREEELARQAYVQHALGDRLVADANEWEMRGRLRRYLAEMAARIESIADDEERAAAVRIAASVATCNGNAGQAAEFFGGLGP